MQKWKLTFNQSPVLIIAVTALRIWPQNQQWNPTISARIIASQGKIQKGEEPEEEVSV